MDLLLTVAALAIIMRRDDLSKYLLPRRLN
jgi:hypothetical protein